MVGIRLLILIGCSCHLAECAKRDIVFVLDRSSSLSADDVNDAIEFIFNVTSFLTIGDQDVQISIVTFSDNVRTEFNFSKHTTKEDLLVAITALKGMSTSGGTHTYTALEHVQNDIFVSAAGARADAEKFVVVMTDGASVDLLKTVSAANELRDDLDATLFSVAIGKDPDRDEINGIANDPDSYYVASASDFIYLCNVVPALVPKLDSSASATISADCPVDVQYTTESTSAAVTPTDSDVEQQSQESTSSSTFIWIIAGLLFLLLLVLLTCCGVLYLQKKKSAPTGSGKSLVFEIAPLVLKAINNLDNCTVIVVSPLVSLMRSQSANLRKKNIKALFLKDILLGQCSTSNVEEDFLNLTLSDVKRGVVDILFASPESLLDHQRGTITELSQRGLIKALFVDEAHCIPKYGKPDKTRKTEAYRPCYGRLGELRSIAGKNVPVIAMTATATPGTKSVILKDLCMENCHEVVLNPNKENITYWVVPVNGDDAADNFQWEKNKEKSKVPYQEIEMLSSPIVSTQRKPVFRDPSTLSSNCWTSSSDRNEELVASSLHNLARESTKSVNSLLYKDMLNFRPSSRQNHWV